MSELKMHVEIHLNDDVVFTAEGRDTPVLKRAKAEMRRLIEEDRDDNYVYDLTLVAYYVTSIWGPEYPRS